MKIVETRVYSSLIPEKDRAAMDSRAEQVVFAWDLTHDYDFEYYPDEIDRCMQTALEASHENS